MYSCDRIFCLYFKTRGADGVNENTYKFLIHGDWGRNIAPFTGTRSFVFILLNVGISRSGASNARIMGD